VPEAGTGDYVLVHAGFAIARVDPEEAERVFALLAELGPPDEIEMLR
jgi:hydrogenase expression/formation protein HypC